MTLSLARSQLACVRRIAILAFPGADELDIVGAHRVLCGAARMNAGIEVCDVLAAEPGLSHILSSHNLSIGVSGVLDTETAANYDMIIVPGGRGAWRPTDPNLVALLLSLAQSISNLQFASVCTGAFLLAAAGIIGRGCTVATHHLAGAELVAEYGVSLESKRVAVTAMKDVPTKVVITAQGVTSGIDLALCVLEFVAGEEKADSSAAMIEYPRFKLTE